MQSCSYINLCLRKANWAPIWMKNLGPILPFIFCVKLFLHLSLYLCSFVSINFTTSFNPFGNFSYSPWSHRFRFCFAFILPRDFNLANSSLVHFDSISMLVIRFVVLLVFFSICQYTYVCVAGEMWQYTVKNILKFYAKITIRTHQMYIGLIYGQSTG